MDLSKPNPYPRYMYYRDSDAPVRVDSKDEENNLLTKGWTTRYIHKEYPKWVGGRIVNSPEEEVRILSKEQPKVINATPVETTISAEGSMKTGAFEFEGLEESVEKQKYAGKPKKKK
jgi:hypothetical protein